MAIAKNAKNEQVNCFDCKKELNIIGSEIQGGVLLKYEDEGKEIYAYKCTQCFENNPSLTNFRSCEVYSRIVGYLRPVQQWNTGKKKEYGERKEFILNKE